MVKGRKLTKTEWLGRIIKNALQKGTNLRKKSEAEQAYNSQLCLAEEYFIPTSNERKLDMTSKPSYIFYGLVYSAFKSTLYLVVILDSDSPIQT